MDCFSLFGSIATSRSGKPERLEAGESPGISAGLIDSFGVYAFPKVVRVYVE